MKIRILKPIAGVGDFVEDSPKQFCLDAGMVATVENETAAKWCEAGIAVQYVESALRETAMLENPANAKLPKAAAKPRKQTR